MWGRQWNRSCMKLHLQLIQLPRKCFDEQCRPRSQEFEHILYKISRILVGKPKQTESLIWLCPRVNGELNKACLRKGVKRLARACAHSNLSFNCSLLQYIKFFGFHRVYDGRVWLACDNAWDISGRVENYVDPSKHGTSVHVYPMLETLGRRCTKFTSCVHWDVTAKRHRPISVAQKLKCGLLDEWFAVFGNWNSTRIRIDPQVRWGWFYYNTNNSLSHWELNNSPFFKLDIITFKYIDGLLYYKVRFFF